MPRQKAKYMSVPTPAPVLAPAPPKMERIAYAGYEEASEATGISEDELAQAVNSGRLPAETSRKPYLILRVDLEAYIKDRNHFVEGRAGIS